MQMLDSFKLEDGIRHKPYFLPLLALTLGTEGAHIDDLLGNEVLLGNITHGAMHQWNKARSK